MKRISTSVLVLLAAVTISNAQNRASEYGLLKSAGSFLPASNKTTTTVCDTLFNFLSTDTMTIYIAGTGGVDGYVSGQNSYGDKAKAEYFASGVAGQTIQNAIIEFAVSTYGSATDQFAVKIWDATGPSGAPGTELASVNVDYTAVESDISFGLPTFVSFASPVTLTGPFYLGYEFTYGAGDTIAAYTTIGPAAVNTAWEKWSDDSWNPFSLAQPNGWGLSVNMGILAEVCSVTGIQQANASTGVIVSPNPSNGVIKVAIANKIKDASIEVINPLGDVVYSTSNVSAFNTISLDQVKNGLYLVKVKSDGKETQSRILISK